MATFPLPFRPKEDYHKGGRKFGAGREGGGRKHAACDLIAPKGTEIYAVEDGVVVRGPYDFYHGTDAIEFKLKSSGRIVRYCEIKGLARGVHVGSKLKEGDPIAFVGKMYRDSMLHFEMYEGTATGGLSDRSNKPYNRRKDLMDPTEYLDACILRNVLTAKLEIEAMTAAARGDLHAVPVRWIR
jgi:murein DD-endopeptidase MepM/ murein hydrolase activator NlpD